MNKYDEIVYLMQHIGKDPSRLIFEDELTGIYNRRFLHNYFTHKVSWDTLSNHPVALLMMDVDHFKQINDTYGHQVGDQTLIWVAELLKEVAGDTYIPIRYAGDEFLIFLPGADRGTASSLGRQLLQLVHERTFRSETLESSLTLTFSIGVAAAPEDAHDGKGLVHKADTALYYAKKRGRNRLASAGDVDPEEVFDKAAIQQFQVDRMVGRRTHLGQIADALKRFSKGESQFIIAGGPAGIGKTSFLEVIRRNLGRMKTIGQTKIQGQPHEMFVPYYLASRMVLALLNQRPDHGEQILEGLTLRELAYLDHIIPGIAGRERPRAGDEELTLREGLFDTLVHFIPRIVDHRPLVLLIDDLHFSDEATLLLIRQLIHRRDIPVFVCASAREPNGSSTEEETPLENFLRAHRKDLGLATVTLTPLAPPDIRDLLQGMFPGWKVPTTFLTQLTDITEGNPLFITEIIRALVLDQRIKKEKGQWVFDPPKEGYLPRSLDEVVARRLAALDDEGRRLLQRASAMGEDVPLSMLTGSTQEHEAKILEVLDRAAAQGLIQTDFEVNDEVIHFPGKGVLEATYRALPSREKKDIHHQIGVYSELLYRQRLLPSAAPVAYHYGRSEDEQKATVYQQVLVEHISKTFNPIEARLYTGERRREVAPPGKPLDPQSLTLIPSFIRFFITAVRSFKLYPEGSKAITTAQEQLKSIIDQILVKNQHLTVFQIQQALMINSQRIDVTDFKGLADGLLKFLDQMELKGIIFSRGMSDRELSQVFEVFGRIKAESIHQEFWQQFSNEKKLKHIELRQVRYALIVDELPATGKKGPRGQTLRHAASNLPAQLLTGQMKLDREDVRQVSEVLRCLLAAVKGIRLYPVTSATVVNAIDQLMNALRPFLEKKKILTVAGVSNSLVANNIRVDISEFESVAMSFFRFLQTSALTSLTFLESLSTRDLRSFIGALGSLPAGGPDEEFWRRLSHKEQLTGILFNQVLYETRVMAPSATRDDEASTHVTQDILKVTLLGEEGQELFNALREAEPSRVADLLLRPDPQPVQDAFAQLFASFHGLSDNLRKKILSNCRTIWSSLTLALQHRFAELVCPELLAAFGRERDPGMIKELAGVLHPMAHVLIQFGDYPRASRILLRMHARRRQLEQSGTPADRFLLKILDQRIDDATRKHIVEDLKSGDSARQKSASLLLGSLGSGALDLLVSIVSQEDDFRMRHIAATLLAGLGSPAAERLKRELVLRQAPREQKRILDIADIVTRDLKTELAFALASDDPEVRHAAMDLAERLQTEEVFGLLLNLVGDQHLRVALTAIDCLARLKPPGAAEILVTLLETSKEPERVAACCRALGEIADSASVASLAKIVRGGRFPLFRKTHGSDVRATAVYALAQIDDPEVVVIMTDLMNDSDERIREIARRRLTNSPVASTPA